MSISPPLSTSTPIPREATLRSRAVVRTCSADISRDAEIRSVTTSHHQYLVSLGICINMSICSYKRTDETPHCIAPDVRCVPVRCFV